MRFKLLKMLVLVVLLSGCGTPTTSTPDAGSSSNAASSDAAANTNTASGGQATEMKKAVLMLNWVPYGEHAPFYYGLEKGFFADEGIDLEIQPGGGSGKTVQAVGSNQVTFGYADTPALIKSVAAGVPVKSIGVFLQTTPSAVQFFSDQNIKSPADLKGKSVAVTPGDAVFQTFPAFLAANDMSIDDVQQINVDASGKIAILIEGKADTLIGFFHDQAPTIESKSGKQVDVLRYADWGVNFLSTGLLANNDTLKNDPEMVRAFLKAAIRSWQEAEKDQAGAVDAMIKLAEKAPDKEVLTEQLAKTMTLLHTSATKDMPPGVNAEADWQATIDVLTKYAELKDAGSPSDYWDASFAPKQ